MMEIISEAMLDKKISIAKELYRSEIKDFKEAGHKFLNGDITSGEFKGSSGGQGVYAQKSQKEFMLRLRVLSGVLDFNTLKLIQSFANDYSLSSIHMTTRQAIQLHDLKFDDVIEIMEKSIENDLFTRGGGGNFPRNVSLSSLSGVEKGEAFDVTPYALFVNKYFLSQMNTYKLPRKFKAAFSNNDTDSGNASIADIGFIAVKKDDKEYFKLFIGGSLGPNADISVQYDELINPKDILYHVEAILSLFKEEGDYENKAKARIRYIVKRMGKEEFLLCYKKHLNKMKENKNLEFEFVNKYELKGIIKEENLNEKLIDNPDVICQKQNNLCSVVIHPQGGILKTEDLNKIVRFLENIEEPSIRISMEESMIIRNLSNKQAEELLELTKDLRNTTRLGKSISCIGVPTCQIGVQNSQKLLADILKYFNESGLNEDIIPSVSISGCVNSCGRHQVNLIGFQGKKKRVNDEIVDVFTFYAGGNTSIENTTLSKEYGDILASDIPELLYKLALSLKEKNKNVEFGEYIVSHKEEFESILEKYLV